MGTFDTACKRDMRLHGRSFEALVEMLCGKEPLNLLKLHDHLEKVGHALDVNADILGTELKTLSKS